MALPLKKVPTLKEKFTAQANPPVEEIKKITKKKK